MLHTPSKSPRVALAPKTNTLDTPHFTGTFRPKAISFLPTPPADRKLKRRIPTEENPLQKRLKLCQKTNENDSSSDSESDEDHCMQDVEEIQARSRRNTAFQQHNRFISGPPTACRRYAPSTMALLRSFVSSNKSDIFKCNSVELDTYLTPPYACSYSHGAKAGRVSLLAVATEQGTVHVLNTSKRQDWDAEASRTTFQAHNNGIFDIKWNLNDSSLATCSGDASIRISDVQTGEITAALHGHASTVKCVAWDPSNPSLLATGGRDGAICLWDLRTGVGSLQDEDGDLSATKPTLTIHGAHEDMAIKSRPRARRGKHQHVPRTVTALLYPESQPHGLVSSGSYDGILRYWDLRTPVPLKKTKSTKPITPKELYCSPVDPATTHGSKRPRGIITLASGSGPSAGVIFAIGTDSRIQTYDLPTLTAQSQTYSHQNLRTSTFYVGLSVSSCGRWLACGGSAKRGNSFLFDVENAGRPGSAPGQGIELKSQAGDVGAVDWAQDTLATCLDDGIVRVWRPDVETYTKCLTQPEESQWDWLWSA